MKILLVVDLQEEFRDADGQFERILDFVKRAKKTGGYEKVIATKCLNREDCAFMRYEAWDDCLQGAKPLPFVPDEVLEKYSYGLPDYGLLDPNAHYDIVGFNTEACVLKIALDLFDRNFDFCLLGEYCYSSEGREHHARGLAVAEALLGTSFVPPRS